MVDRIYHGESDGELIGYAGFSPDLLNTNTRFFVDDAQRDAHLIKEKVRNTRLVHIACISFERSDDYDKDLYNTIKEYGVEQPVYAYRDFNKFPLSYVAPMQFDILNVVSKLSEDGINNLVPIIILHDFINPEIIPKLIEGHESLDRLEKAYWIYDLISRGKIKENGRPGFLSEHYLAALVGLSQTTVDRYKYVGSNLCPAVLEAYKRGNICWSKMRVIAMAYPKDQVGFLEMAPGISTQELESRVSRTRLGKHMVRHGKLPGKVRGKKAIYDTWKDLQNGNREGDKYKAETLAWVLSLKKKI